MIEEPDEKIPIPGPLGTSCRLLLGGSAQCRNTAQPSRTRHRCRRQRKSLWRRFGCPPGCRTQLFHKHLDKSFPRIYPASYPMFFGTGLVRHRTVLNARGPSRTFTRAVRELGSKNTRRSWTTSARSPGASASAERFGNARGGL